MRRLRVGILDLIGNRPTPGLWNRLMKPNFASIMPQVDRGLVRAAGARRPLRVPHGQRGHRARAAAPDLDLLFIAAFTNAAQRAAAISGRYRAAGVVTVVGGPHARCYPEDAARYFDYVLGFTDKPLLAEVLRDCAPHRPLGLVLSATKHPPQLPGVRERWKFIEPTIAKAPAVKIVPMIGSLGCPYTCSFCIDSEVDYQPLARDQIQEDLRFLLKTVKHPRVGWHDPNFGVRFDETMARDRGGRPAGRDRLRRREQPLDPDGAAPGAAAEERLQGDPAGHRVLVRHGRQVEDRGGGRPREGGPGLGPREPDPALHPLRADQLRARARHRRGRGALRADEALRREDAGGLPGLLALLRLRPGRAREPRAAARRARAPVPVPLPRQQPGDERAAEELLVVGPLRPDHRPAPALLLGSRRRAAPRREPGPADPLAELRARPLDARVSAASATTRRSAACSTPTCPLRRFFECETRTVPDFYAERVERDLGPLWEWLPKGALEHDPNAYLKAQAGTQVADGRRLTPERERRLTAARARRGQET